MSEGNSPRSFLCALRSVLSHVARVGRLLSQPRRATPPGNAPKGSHAPSTHCPRANEMAISNRLPPVRVEYDRNGSRVSKQFANAFEARRFYVAKAKQGRNPTVKKGE